MKVLCTLFERQLHREILLQTRQINSLLQRSLFFLMICLLFPLTMPPQLSIIRNFVPGLVWIAIFFGFLLSSAVLFHEDNADGYLEQWLISGYPLSLMVTAKIIVHWVFNILPIMFFCPILALLFHISLHEMLILLSSIVVGTPAILFLCALAASFCLDFSQQGILMGLIILPLVLPIMVFGSGTLTAVMQGTPVLAYLAILLAISLLSLAFIPFAIAAVIRVSLVK